MPYSDPDRRNAYMREYYARDPKPQLARVAERNKAVQVFNRNLINEAKSVPCSDCGIAYPYYVMDFDHVRGEKLFDIGAAHGARYTTRKILEEIAKCEVVCSNCHRIRTHGHLDE